MATTNWTIVTRRKEDGKLVLFPLKTKWTYKTAIGIASESTTKDFDLVCVVETNKIMLKNDKEEEKKSDI